LDPLSWRLQGSILIYLLQTIMPVIPPGSEHADSDAQRLVIQQRVIEQQQIRQHQLEQEIQSLQRSRDSNLVMANFADPSNSGQGPPGDKVETNIQRLNGKNWASWKWQITTILEAKGLLDGIDEAARKGSPKELAARQVISCSLDQSLVNKVIHCSTAHQIWNCLESLYENKTSFALTALIGKMNTYRMTSLDQVEDGISEFQAMAAQIRTMGGAMDDALVESAILRALPKSFRSFEDSWSLQRQEDRTLEKLHAHRFETMSPLVYQQTDKFIDAGINEYVIDYTFVNPCDLIRHVHVSNGNSTILHNSEGINVAVQAHTEECNKLFSNTWQVMLRELEGKIKPTQLYSDEIHQDNRIIREKRNVAEYFLINVVTNFIWKMVERHLPWSNYNKIKLLEEYQKHETQSIQKFGHEFNVSHAIQQGVEIWFFQLTCGVLINPGPTRPIKTAINQDNDEREN